MNLCQIYEQITSSKTNNLKKKKFQKEKKKLHFKNPKQSHCLVHCTCCQTKNRFWINNQNDQYWTIMQMVKNMPKSSIDVENFKYLPTMNRI
jgi:hypothetical protein